MKGIVMTKAQTGKHVILMLQTCRENKTSDWCGVRIKRRDDINEPRRQKTGLQGFRPGPTQTGLCNYWRWLEAWNFRFRKKRNCTIRIAKTKALISFAVTAKLICVFFSPMQKSGFFTLRLKYNNNIRLPRSWSATLFSPMQKSGFLTLRLKYNNNITSIWHKVSAG